MQLSASSPLPSHVLPPPLGAGELQSRRLRRSQRLLQTLQSLHSSQPPSTGHGALQVIFCTDMPSQKAPPLSGAGLVQVRVRFWTPRPHGALQADHSVHKDQPPLTVGGGAEERSVMHLNAARKAGNSGGQSRLADEYLTSASPLSVIKTHENTDLK